MSLPEHTSSFHNSGERMGGELKKKGELRQSKGVGYEKGSLDAYASVGRLFGPEDELEKDERVVIESRPAL